MKEQKIIYSTVRKITQCSLYRGPCNNTELLFSWNAKLNQTFKGNKMVTQTNEIIMEVRRCNVFTNLKVI